LNKLRFLDIGNNHDCFDVARERLAIGRLSEECLVPVNRLLLQLCREQPGIQLTFSVSGVMLAQLEAYAPAALKTFRKLAETGLVEFLSETYYHSLAFMLPGTEFEDQVVKHADKLEEHFGARPSAFRNTGMPYNEEIARRVSAMGYSGIIVDGKEPILDGWSPNYVYEHSAHDYLRILINNAGLTNTLYSQFTRQANHSLPARHIPRLALPSDKAEVVTFSINYGSLCGDQETSRRNLNSLEDLIHFLANSETMDMTTASAAMISRKPHGDFSLQTPSQGEETDQAAEWLANEMQQEAFDMLLSLQPHIHASSDVESLTKWRSLQASDYFSYMCTDTSKRRFINPPSGQYATPYGAFINFMNIASELFEYVRIREFRDRANIASPRNKNSVASPLT
jgi:alpha-amylase